MNSPRPTITPGYQRLIALCAVLLVCGSSAIASSAAEPVTITLRPRLTGEPSTRVIAGIEAIGPAGLTLRQGDGTGTERLVIGLDRLALPLEQPVLDELRRIGGTADLSDLAMTAWRARARLERGDWNAAEPLLESIAPQTLAAGGPTGAATAHGLLTCRIMREARAGAVWAWLDWVRIIRDGPGLPEAPAGSLVASPNVATTRWDGGQINAMIGAAPVDVRTGLAPALPPVWVPGAALEAVISSAEWDRAAGTTAGPVGELAAMYRAAAAFEIGRDAALLPSTGAHDGIRLVREMVTARTGDAGTRSGSRDALRTRLKAEQLDRWVEAWCRTGIGRSLIRESDPQEVRRGVLELLHLPARFSADQSYLAGVALASAAVAMAELGETTTAIALRTEFDTAFPLHPAATWMPLRQIGLSTSRTGAGSWSSSIRGVIAAAVVGIQPESPTLPPPTAIDPVEGVVTGPDDALEAYLQRLGLSTLLAQQLEQRVAALGREARGPVAERLARLYVQLLESATSSDARSDWERRAQKLLHDVPEADGYELRISLARVLYVRAEDMCERARLRMTAGDETAEAERVLRQLEPQFREIASKVHRRVENLERIENQGDGTDELSRQLSDARRIRSLAFYYAGWSSYYIAMLTRPEPAASEAIKSFGWLLNSPNGRAASLDRLPSTMLRYEHVARAAIGCALASSLRGSDSEAMRWLEVVSEAEELPPSVRKQLLSRQIAVLAQAKRWADIERLVRKERNSDRSGGGEGVRPLEVFEARLLAVAALEADARISGTQLEQLARIALGDLIARGEIAHVLDLTDKFGTAPIGESGFIVHYVRGIKSYDDARTAHTAAGSDTEEPSTSEEVTNLYRSSSDLLRAALIQSDAEQYKPERARAALYAARGLFFTGDYSGAADLFMKAWEFHSQIDRDSPDAEESLWLSVVALDRGTSRPGASTEMTQRRAQVGTMFLQTYPDSPRAARLLLMRAAAGDVGDDEALRVLEAVPKDAPMYEAARRQVARILYNRFRSAAGTERDFAALRFITVAEELLALDRKAATASAGADPEAAQRAVLRARQLLDALLGGANPDADRAHSTLDLLRTLARVNNLNIDEHEAELTFRELQIAIARGKDSDALLLAERLAGLPGASREFAPAADRLLYRRAAARFRDSRKPDDRAEAAQSVVSYGVRVIDRVLPGQSLGDAPTDAVGAALLSTVSAAAFELWTASRTAESTEGDIAMRDLSLRLDRSILKSAPNNEESLRRMAATTDAAGDHRAALNCWSLLLAAAPAGSDAWFEARYNALRILAAIEPDRARDLLSQHRVLFPGYGPEPWGARIRELETSLPASAPTARPASPAAPANNGGAP